MRMVMSTYSYIYGTPDMISRVQSTLGLEEVYVFYSKSEIRDRAVEAVEAVSTLGLGLGTE